MRSLLQHGFYDWFWKISVESVCLALSAILSHLVHFNKFPLYEKTDSQKRSCFPRVTQLVRAEVKRETLPSPQDIKLFSETC